MLNRNTTKRERAPSPRNITGARIREVRLSRKPKISQDDLSGRVAALGVTLTRTQVAKVETGRRPIVDYELAAVAKALRITIADLFQSGQ